MIIPSRQNGYETDRLIRICANLVPIELPKGQKNELPPEISIYTEVRKTPMIGINRKAKAPCLRNDELKLNTRLNTENA
jgi:hypothetical protein